MFRGLVYEVNGIRDMKLCNYFDDFRKSNIFSETSVKNSVLKLLEFHLQGCSKRSLIEVNSVFET